MPCRRRAAAAPAPGGALHTDVAGQTPDEIIQHAVGRRAADKPGYQGPAGGASRSEKTRDNTIRVDTSRLDQVLNLSGEIGLTKNRLTSLRSDILNGRSDTDTLHALDQAVSQLDLLVSDLQNAVMKTRMQPIGRLFQKYPRIARDLARSLGKDVELVLAGEETEIDKTMIEDLVRSDHPPDPQRRRPRRRTAAGARWPPASRKSRRCAWRRARKAITSSSSSPTTATA